MRTSAVFAPEHAANSRSSPDAPNDIAVRMPHDVRERWQLFTAVSVLVS